MRKRRIDAVRRLRCIAAAGSDEDVARIRYSGVTVTAGNGVEAAPAAPGPVLVRVPGLKGEHHRGVSEEVRCSIDGIGLGPGVTPLHPWDQVTIGAACQDRPEPCLLGRLECRLIDRPGDVGADVLAFHIGPVDHRRRRVPCAERIHAVRFHQRHGCNPLDGREATPDRIGGRPSPHGTLSLPSEAGRRRDGPGMPVMCRCRYPHPARGSSSP